MPQHSGGKGGSRKHGRNKVKCSIYRAEGRLEKNRDRRIAKHERRHGRGNV